MTVRGIWCAAFPCPGTSCLTSGFMRSFTASKRLPFTPAAAAMAVPADSLGDYAVPRLVDRYLMQAGSDDSSF